MLQVGIGVLVVVSLLLLLVPFLNRQQAVADQLEVFMRLVRSDLGNRGGPEQNTDKYTPEVYAKTMGSYLDVRMTIFDPFGGGEVLSDSNDERDEDLMAMWRNGKFPEVDSAIKRNYGYDTRREGNVDYLYYAAKISITQVEGKQWIVRIRERLPSFTETLKVYGQWIYVAPLLLIGMIIGFSLFRTRGIMMPLQDMVSQVSTINQGNYDQRIEQMGDDEVARLAASFNVMSMRIKETAAMLSRTSGELTSILDTMMSGLVAVDSTMRIIHINKTAADMLGMKIDQAINRHFIDSTLNVRIEGFLRAAMEQDALYQADMVVSLPKGETVLRLYISPLKHGPIVSGAITLLEDVTELRRLEQVRTDFATNVSHELKTPLTSIKGFVETLQQGAMQDPVMSGKFLNIISLEADRLGRLINDIISLNKLESGKEDLIKEPISLHDQAQVVMEMMLPHANMKNQTLLLEERAEELCVLSSADHVRQLLINLLDNAIKYTPPNGTIKLMVDRYADKALIRVVDTGYGIEKEHLARLFERFYRVDKGRSRNMGGTGLGLAIVKHIVNSMDGRIDVASEVGMGSVFTVELRAYDERGNPLGHPEQHSA